jgi:hypothetical protein
VRATLLRTARGNPLALLELLLALTDAQLEGVEPDRRSASGARRRRGSVHGSDRRARRAGAPT